MTNFRVLTPPADLATRDPRTDRCKVYVMPLAAVIQFLCSDGVHVPKVEGWDVAADAEAVILGQAVLPGAQPLLALTVYSPTFPFVLQNPPVVLMSGAWRVLPEGVTWEDLPLPEAPADAAST